MSSVCERALKTNTNVRAHTIYNNTIYDMHNNNKLHRVIITITYSLSTIVSYQYRNSDHTLYLLLGVPVEAVVGVGYTACKSVCNSVYNILSLFVSSKYNISYILIRRVDACMIGRMPEAIYFAITLSRRLRTCL